MNAVTLTAAAQGYTISTTVPLDHGDAVAAVRTALADQGLGVLTEIDLAATMQAKLGKEIPRQVILGACRPSLAYEALQADPSVAAMLPCNVVVRELDDGASIVEAFDPEAMLSFSRSPAIAGVAADAKQRLLAVVEALRTTQGATPPNRDQES